MRSTWRNRQRDAARHRRAVRARIRWVLVATLAGSLTDSFDIFGIDANSLANHIIGWFSALFNVIVGDLWTPVATSISYALGRFAALVDDSFAGLWGAMGWLGGGIGSFYDYVYGRFTDIWTFAEGVYWDSFNGLNAIGHAIWDTTSEWFGSLYQTVSGWITAGLHDLFTVGSELWDWVDTHVIQPIESELANLWNTVNGVFSWVTQTVGNLIADALHGLFDAGSWVWDLISPFVQGLIDAAIQPLLDLFHLVEGAANFLTWIVAHPFTWFTDQVDQFLADGADALMRHVVSALGSEGSTVEDFLAANF